LFVGCNDQPAKIAVDDMRAQPSELAH